MFQFSLSLIIARAILRTYYIGWKDIHLLHGRDENSGGEEGGFLPVVSIVS